jgi:hypothetical protein
MSFPLEFMVLKISAVFIWRVLTKEYARNSGPNVCPTYGPLQASFKMAELLSLIFVLNF